MTDRAPDLAQAVIGFRQWRLRDGGLYSVWFGDRWDRGFLRARCRTGACEAPQSDCACGVHAWHDPVPLGASALPRDLVTGAVALWGAIELHAAGMRAERARVVALARPLAPGRKRAAIAALADELGVALVPHHRLAAAARAHGAPVPASLKP